MIRGATHTHTVLSCTCARIHTHTVYTDIVIKHGAIHSQVNEHTVDLVTHSTSTVTEALISYKPHFQELTI